MLLASMVEFLQRNSEQGIQNWTETQEVAHRLRQRVEEEARESPLHLFERRHFIGRMLLSEYDDCRGRYTEARAILTPYIERDEIITQLRHKDPKLYARFALQCCRAEYRQRKFKAALERAEEARKINEEHKVGLGTGLSYFYRASVYYRLWDLDQAEHDIHQAIRIFHRRNRERGTPLQRDYQIDLSKVLLARIIRRAGAPHQHVHVWLDEAERGLHNTQDYVNQARLWQVRGRVIRAEGDPEGAERCFRKAICLYNRAEHHVGRAIVYTHLGHLYTRIGGSESRAKLRLENYEQAERFLQTAKDIEHADRRARADTWYRFAQLYLQWGETERDEEKLQRAASWAQDTLKEAKTMHARSLGASVRIALAYVQLFAQAYRVTVSVEGGQSVEELTAQADRVNHDPKSEQVLSQETQTDCWLLKALIHCWSDAPNKLMAKHYLGQAQKALIRRPHEYLMARAEKITQEIEKLSGDFHISESGPMSIPRHVEALSYWLVVTVVRKLRTEQKFNRRGGIDRDEAATRLGTTRSTLERMVREWEENSNDKANLAGIPPEDRKGLFARLFGRDCEPSLRIPPVSRNDNVSCNASARPLWAASDD